MATEMGIEPDRNIINICMLTCNHCQSLFKPDRTNHNNPKKYCSMPCSRSAKAKQLNKCIVCNADTYNPKFCCHSCSASFTNSARGARSPNTKAAISNKLQGYGKFTAILFCKCEICNADFLWNSISKGSKRHCTNEKCFSQFKHNVKKGKTGGFRKNSTRVHRSIYKDQQMDSGAELAFAQLLDKHNIVWQKNSTIFFEYMPGKRYYPDFYLPDYNQWVEIKGKKYIRNDDSIRWAAVPGLEVIWSHDIKLPKCMAGIIGNDPT